MRMPFGLPWWTLIAVFVPLFWLNKRAGVDQTRGRVVGITGRMGSGKSYMACRLAWRRMSHGANVITNFSMHLGCQLNACSCGKGDCSAKRRRHKRKGCACTMAARWRRFHDWPDLLVANNAVVIIDEADLYAPSHDYNAITDEVRWKLKMARKHGLDIYWIAQGPNRVNSILRGTLTNEIAVCRSWFNGLYFSAKFYEPESVGRRNKHTARIGYRMNKKVADLYDTLETIEGSEYAGDDTMSNVNNLVANFEEKRLKARERKAPAKPTTARARVRKTAIKPPA